MPDPASAPADCPAPEPAARASALAAEHSAAVLAAALVERLRLDERGELAAAVASLLSELGAVDPNPPNPH